LCAWDEQTHIKSIKKELKAPEFDVRGQIAGRSAESSSAAREEGVLCVEQSRFFTCNYGPMSSFSRLITRFDCRVLCRYLGKENTVMRQVRLRMLETTMNLDSHDCFHRIVSRPSLSKPCKPSSMLLPPRRPECGLVDFRASHHTS